ncbi:hypothetical protein LCGC14_2497780 [marine sediment metagenome]|uniref:Uncharacterized protein n=1 Tax=marine sediment metagenome TaxID=412755 RepID=A0A0F9DEQ1_9ZZZZ
MKCQFITICMNCKKLLKMIFIEGDEKKVYSHGLCDNCSEKYYPDQRRFKK